MSNTAVNCTWLCRALRTSSIHGRQTWSTSSTRRSLCTSLLLNCVGWSRTGVGVLFWSCILIRRSINSKTSAVSTIDGSMKLIFASCVIRQTRSLGELVLCYICNMMLVNYIDDVVVDKKFHKFYGRPFTRVVYRSMYYLMKNVAWWLPWVKRTILQKFQLLFRNK